MVVLPRIVSVATAVPENRFSQQEILSHLGQHFSLYRKPRVEKIFLNAGIEYRHLVLSRETFDPAADPDELHAIYRHHSLELGRKVASDSLRQAGLKPEDIDLLVVATCTGYTCPGLSARLASTLDMPSKLQRADLVGMGCSGAMPALQRAQDFVRAYPDKRALAVAVEVSSACWYVDNTMETVVGNTICADGAAAAVIAAGEGRGPRLAHFTTVLDPSYLESVGFEFKGGKNRIILDANLRSGAGPIVRKAVDELLEETGTQRASVDHWVVHSGGRRVLDGIDSALGFANGELRHSREILRLHGNMSSPTVLFALERTMRDARSGEAGVMIALGPGLAAEAALLRW
jgi:predicted naringenin-chalcone synthase